MRGAPFLTVALVLGATVAFTGQPCADHCAVVLDQPDAVYPRGTTVQLAVRNITAKALGVIVVLDAYIDGEWQETPLSPSHPDHPFKMFLVSPIAPGGTLVLNFPACAALKIIPQGGGGRDVLVPCSKRSPPLSSQYRLHAFVTGPDALREEVVSSPYRILPN